VSETAAQIYKRDTFFEPVDRPAPDFTLATADGRRVSLHDFRGKVVVLDFIYTGCKEECPLQSDLLARVQHDINKHHADARSRGPINTAHLAGFASTGGWTLGRSANGAVYFNQVEAVTLTERQAFLALAVATNTFRPCCDNSTFFRDCSHGSALLGLIELAASQGATADAIYRMALVANSLWFPEQYARTAQYFADITKRSWRLVSASQVMGRAYSSLTGWQLHVEAPLRQANIALPADPRAAGAGERRPANRGLARSPLQ
jgi:SCO1/SenC